MSFGGSALDRHDARGRDPREHRRARDAPRPRTTWPVRATVTATYVARSPVAAPAVTSSPRSRWPTSWSRAATRATRSTSSAPRAASRRPRCPPPASPSTCCPGAGLQRGLTPRALLAERRALLGRPSSPSSGRAALVRRLRPQVVVGVGGYASLPALVAAAALRHPDGGPRADAAPGPRQPDRGAPRRPCRGLAPRHAAARRGASPATRSGPRSPRCAAAPVDTAAGRGGRRQPRRPLAQRGGPRPRRPLARAASDVMIHHVSGCPRLRRVPHAGCEALRRPGDALGYRLVPFEEHMEDIYTDATLVVSRLGRDDRRAHRGRRARGAGAAPRRARRPPDPQRRGAGRGRRRGDGRATPSSTPARLDAELDALLADPDRLGAMARRRARARAARRHRPVRRPRRGGGRCAR